MEAPPESGGQSHCLQIGVRRIWRCAEASHGAPRRVCTGGGTATLREEEVTKQSGQDAITELEEYQVPMASAATFGK